MVTVVEMIEIIHRVDGQDFHAEQYYISTKMKT